jgi:hypothetical protein
MLPMHPVLIERSNNIEMTSMDNRLFIFSPCWRPDHAPSARIGSDPSAIDYLLFAIGERSSPAEHIGVTIFSFA